jgi:hypothetical protein
MLTNEELDALKAWVKSEPEWSSEFLTLAFMDTPVVKEMTKGWSGTDTPVYYDLEEMLLLLIERARDANVEMGPVTAE